MNLVVTEFDIRLSAVIGVDVLAVFFDTHFISSGNLIETTVRRHSLEDAVRTAS